MFTATANLTLPAPSRLLAPPRWFDVSMWGRPLDTCMMDVRFREKFQDALAVVVSDQERAGLDLLTTATSTATRTWPGAPGITIPAALAGFEGDHLQPEETRAPGCTTRRARS